MKVTRLSSKGQITLPKALRASHKWEAGQDFVVIVVDTGNGVLLKPEKPFPETKLEDVAGCLAYQGEPKTIEEMNVAINRGFQEQFSGTMDSSGD
jgi:AbrB family looped-hinge helix DNA binding protein